MKTRTLIRHFAVIGVALVVSATAQSQSVATLDRIISSKTLRCGVQLDFPPLGFRNAQNEPEGYDVAYCKDIAKALGATAQIVETPSAERIPALVSNRIDILVAGTSITSQRALSVAFTQPYTSFIVVTLTHKDANVNSFEDFKGRTIGGVTGTTPELWLRARFDEWNDPKGKFISYGSESESFLALNQRRIDGVIVNAASAGALIRSGQFPNLVIKGEVPMPPDLTGIAVRKSDTELLRWLKVFVWEQGVTGRYAELYRMYFGDGPVPPLRYPGVEY